MATCTDCGTSDGVIGWKDSDDPRAVYICADCRRERDADLRSKCRPMSEPSPDDLRIRRLDPDAPAPPLEGGDWGLVDDLDDGHMGEPGDLGDGAE